MIYLVNITYIDFEVFVELGNPSIEIEGKIYYRHQVCLYLTFDLKTMKHYLECLILPSYDQMSHNRQPDKRQVFSHYRFPYLIELDDENYFDISMLGDISISAQLVRVIEDPSYKYKIAY